MEVQELITEARDVTTARRVYGDPVERNGVTVVPAAVVRSSGNGTERSDLGEEGAGGSGLVAKPVGAWVITDTSVTWKPALDVNRIVLVGQVIGLPAVVLLVVLGRLLLARSQQKDS